MVNADVVMASGAATVSVRVLLPDRVGLPVSEAVTVTLAVAVAAGIVLADYIESVAF